MGTTTTRYSQEVRERAVRMVSEHRSEYPSEWATIASISSKIGCTAETLRRWVARSQVDAGTRPGLNSSERERLKQLERENRELKRANEILRKASVFSPRRSSTAERSDGGVHRHPPCRVWGRADLRRVADRPFDVL